MEKSAGARQARSTDISVSSHTPSANKAKPKSTASSRREKPHLVRVKFTKKAPKLSAAQRERFAKLAAMPDDQIDTSDIPERLIGYSGPTYIGLFPGFTTKKSVTIRLDSDVVKWFKAHGKGWQTKMNWVLRLYFASHRKQGAKVGRP
jgi:uncharacterized protein (DUF4415 family)